MHTVDDKKAKHDLDISEDERQGLLAGPSTSALAPPPTYSEQPTAPFLSIDETTLLPRGGEAPPPEFAPYEAECARTSSGDVFSHDAHLNTDGEALYRFLLSQAAAPPRVLLKLKGSHEERHSRLVTSTNAKGEARTHTEWVTETVVDFTFTIDVGQHLPHGAAAPTHWSVPDAQPAYRGRMVRDVGVAHDDGLGAGRRRARRKEIKAADQWARERALRGLPPWVSHQELEPDALERSGGLEVLQSSWTLRRWADDYCASPKQLKEFVYRKVPYGWNFDALVTAVRAIVNSTHYRGTVDVRFETSADKILVRSSNKLSRALSKTWVKVLLCLTLIYPFILLYKRFHKRGGGSWEVCGGAYALKSFADPAPALFDPEHGTDGEGRQLVKTPRGLKALVGLREGEWMKRWEATIRNGVLARKADRVPLTVPDESGWNTAAIVLDGYVD